MNSRLPISSPRREADFRRRLASATIVEQDVCVVVADVQDDKGEWQAEQPGSRASYLRTDLGEERDIEALVAHAFDKFCRLDCIGRSPGPGGPRRGRSRRRVIELFPGSALPM
jgi:hypothetical protein